MAGIDTVVDVDAVVVAVVVVSKMLVLENDTSIGRIDTDWNDE